MDKLIKLIVDFIKKLFSKTNEETVVKEPVVLTVLTEQEIKELEADQGAENIENGYIEPIVSTIEPVVVTTKPIVNTPKPKPVVSDGLVTMEDVINGIKYSTVTEITLKKKISKHFKLKEALLYNNGTQIAPLSILRDNPVLLDNIKKHAKNMDAVRDFYNAPIYISSWLRTSYWNKKVGGASNSQHLYGLATDFNVIGTSPAKVQKDFNTKWKGGLGSYNTFTHMDSRSVLSRWKG